MDKIEKNALAERIETFSKTNSVDKAINTVSADLNSKIEEQSVLEGKEKKQVVKRVRKIWNNYRSNVLSQFDLENFKKYCKLEVEKAETDLALLKVKNEKELTELEHWLKKNSGNLKEIGYNTESKPSTFWYKLNRGVWYLKKTFSNIPKLTWYILAGVCGIGIIILMAVGLSKFV